MKEKTIYSLLLKEGKQSFKCNSVDNFKSMPSSIAIYLYYLMVFVVADVVFCSLNRLKWKELRTN